MQSCSNRLLDLVFTNLTNSISIGDDVPLVIEDSYHPAISVTVFYELISTSVVPISSSARYDFRKTALSKLHNELFCADWNSLNNFVDTDEAMNE